MICGRPLEGSALDSAAPPPTAPTLVGNYPAPDSQDANLSSSPRKSTRVFWTAALVIALAAAAIIVAVLRLRQPVLSPGSESAGAANAGAMKDQQLNQGHSPSLRRLTTDPSRDIFPVWLSDAKILFQSNRNSGRANGTDIWEMNPDGSGQTEIVRVIVSTPAAWGTRALAAEFRFLAFPGTLLSTRLSTSTRSCRLRSRGPRPFQSFGQYSMATMSTSHNCCKYRWPVRQ